MGRTSLHLSFKHCNSHELFIWLEILAGKEREREMKAGSYSITRADLELTMCLSLASNSRQSFSLSLSSAGTASVSLQARLLSNLLCIYSQAPQLSPFYKGNIRKADGLPKATKSQEKSELDSNVLEQILPQKKIKKILYPLISLALTEAVK